MKIKRLIQTEIVDNKIIERYNAFVKQFFRWHRDVDEKMFDL